MAGPHAVSAGSSATSISSDLMHPRDWVMAQTGLSAAMRDALSVLVAAYGGLQQKNGEFFALESRVEPRLRTSWRTFKNYLTKLRKLGLLEMLARGPNQYGPKTRWRMRLDVFCQSAQMAMNLPMEDETPATEQQVPVRDEPPKEKRGRERGGPATEARDEQEHIQHSHINGTGARHDAD